MARRFRFYLGLLLLLAGCGGAYYTWSVTSPEADRLLDEVAQLTASQTRAAAPAKPSPTEIEVNIGPGRPPVSQQIAQGQAESLIAQHQRAVVAHEMKERRAERLAKSKQEYSVLAGRRTQHYLLSAVALAYGVFSMCLALNRGTGGEPAATDG